MFELEPNTKILVCVGSGGVGKTSVAASLGLSFAEQGKKVLVLTIDPSRRLRTSLGLPAQDGELAQVQVKTPGELWGLVVDPQKTFNEFIRRATSNASIVETLMKNRLYVQLSTNLSGSQEFTALEVLYQNYKSGQFDLIILDTPPTQHAIDFLNAPQKLTALFNEGVAKWFSRERPSGLVSKILNTGVLQVLHVMEKLTGAEFMRELGLFFSNIEKWRPQLEERFSQVHRMLVGPETQFILVTALDVAKINQALWMIGETRKGGYRLKAVVVNRCFPQWLNEADLQKWSSSPSELAGFEQFMKWQNDKRERLNGFRQKLDPTVKVVLMPELEEGVSDLSTLKVLSSVW